MSWERLVQILTWLPRRWPWAAVRVSSPVSWGKRNSVSLMGVTAKMKCIILSNALRMFWNLARGKGYLVILLLLRLRSGLGARAVGQGLRLQGARSWV